jgi:hypothetical protein
MNDNELKKNNIVKRKYYNPNPEKPEYLWEFCFVKSLGITKLHVTESLNLKDNKLIKLDYNGIMPVGLTKEWLIKFGFKNNSINYRYQPHKTIYQITIDHQTELIYSSADTKPVDCYLSIWPEDEHGNICETVFIPNECRFVHQLQNLYFALTGKELKITT